MSGNKFKSMDILATYFFVKWYKKEILTVKYKFITHFIILVYLSLALFSYFFPLPGANSDAIEFRNSSFVSTGYFESGLFSNWNSLLRVSSLSGNFCCCLIPTFLSIYVFVSIVPKCKISFWYLLAIVIFIFNPANLLFCTTSLREPYMLFFMYIWLFKEKSKPIFTNLGVVIYCLLHKGMIITFPLFYCRRIVSFKTLVPLLVVLGLISLSQRETENRFFEIIKKIQNEEIVNYVYYYRESTQSVFASTECFIYSKNILGLLSESFFKYHFGTLFYLYNHPAYFFFALASLVKMYLIIMLIRDLKISLPLIIYIAIALIWSVGSVTYGQMIRHQIGHDIILIFLINENYRSYRNILPKAML